jgi:hypothetical protein
LVLRVASAVVLGVGVLATAGCAPPGVSPSAIASVLADGTREALCEAAAELDAGIALSREAAENRGLSGDQLRARGRAILGHVHESERLARAVAHKPSLPGFLILGGNLYTLGSMIESGGPLDDDEIRAFREVLTHVIAQRAEIGIALVCDQ